MTTCVAIARHGHVVLGADRATNVYDRPVVGVTKIHQYAAQSAQRAAYAIAYAGDGALPAIVAAHHTVRGAPEHDDPIEQRTKWATAIAQAITDLAFEYHLAREGRLDSNLILAHDGHVWTLTHMQAIHHDEGLAAVGSGEEPALGALDAGIALGHAETLTGTQELVHLAVRIGCARDRYSDGGPQILTV